MKTSFLFFDPVKIFFVLSTPIHEAKYLFRRSDVPLLCKCSIRFQVIKHKLLSETLKNEKFLLDI